MIAPDSKMLIGGAAVGRLVIDDRRHAIVGADLEELVFELVALADVARHDVVGRPQLLEQDGDLLAVRRRPIVQVDHEGAPGLGEMRA